jgi:hypothetical protein
MDDKGNAILAAMYEAADGTYTSYTLARELNQTIEMGTPAYVAAFTETRDATERLIARGLVRGERLTGKDGVYFNKLKLTSKGQKMAIERKTGGGVMSVEEAVDQVNSALAEKSNNKKIRG